MQYALGIVGTVESSKFKFKEIICYNNDVDFSSLELSSSLELRDSTAEYDSRPPPSSPFRRSTGCCHVFFDRGNEAHQRRTPGRNPSFDDLYQLVDPSAPRKPRHQRRTPGRNPSFDDLYKLDGSAPRKPRRSNIGSVNRSIASPFRRFLGSFVADNEIQRRKPERNPSFEDLRATLDFAVPRPPRRSSTPSDDELDDAAAKVSSMDQNPNFEIPPFSCHTAPPLPRRASSQAELEADLEDSTSEGEFDNTNYTNEEGHLGANFGISHISRHSAPALPCRTASDEVTEDDSVLTVEGGEGNIDPKDHLDASSETSATDSDSFFKPKAKHSSERLMRSALKCSNEPLMSSMQCTLDNFRLDGSSLYLDTRLKHAAKDSMDCNELESSPSRPQHEDNFDSLQQGPFRSETTAFRKNRLTVSFGTVHVRSYERILSDNPCCRSGPSVGIGWRYLSSAPMDVEMFERSHSRKRRCGSQLLLSKIDREKIAEVMGYSKKDVIQNVRQKYKIKQQRLQTLSRSNMNTENLELALEMARKKVLNVGNLKPDHLEFSLGTTRTKVMKMFSSKNSDEDLLTHKKQSEKTLQL